MKLFKSREQDLPKRRQSERQPIVEAEDSYAFRRGRTLTGSASSLVRTSNESQADLKSSRVHTHELRRKRRRVMGVLGVTLALAAVLYMLIDQFTAQPVVLRASPDSTLALDPVYEEAINDYFSDHMSERWRFLADADQLTDYLQTITPEVKKVTPLGSSGVGRSVFEITFREPIASWDVDGQELYVDNMGVPFTRSYFGSPTLRITDQSGMATALSGESVMSNRFMSYIGQVIGSASTQGYTVETIVIPEGMTRQVEVHIKDISYPFKFASDRPAREGVDDMAKAIQWLKSHQVTPEYVDVRVEGKVYYK